MCDCPDPRGRTLAQQRAIIDAARASGTTPLRLTATLPRQARNLCELCADYLSDQDVCVSCNRHNPDVEDAR